MPLDPTSLTRYLAFGDRKPVHDIDGAVEMVMQDVLLFQQVCFKRLRNHRWQSCFHLLPQLVVPLLLVKQL